jgi:hypothetical protein
VLAWLAAMPALERARTASEITDVRRNAPRSLRCAAILELPRSATYGQVAELLGVSAAAVNKAVTEHRAARPEGGAVEDPAAAQAGRDVR